jgi:LacI family transcriptional regulator
VTTAAARPTMRDVASKAGVSLKTVSRVINDEPSVAAHTATRVSEAIAELGFQRNDLARSLRSGQSSSTLGLIIEDVANPFYSAIAQSVEAVSRDRGYLLITASALEDADRERELVTVLLRRRVDALLVVPAGPDHRYMSDDLGRTSAVFLDRPPARIEADTVLLDNAGGARQAIEHLLGQGHVRIACVCDSADLYTAGERLSGYRATLAAAGIAEDPALVLSGNRDATEARDAVDRLLALPEDRRPTGIFAANNRNTVGALHALHWAHRAVALVGFDDFELADLLGVTVVRSDPAAMGTVAATLAFARLDGDDRPTQRLTIPTTLITRGTGETAL